MLLSCLIVKCHFVGLDHLNSLMQYQGYFMLIRSEESDLVDELCLSTVVCICSLIGRY